MRYPFTATVWRTIPFKMEGTSQLKVQVNKILVDENIKKRHPFTKTILRTIAFKLEGKSQLKIKVNSILVH